MSDRTTWFRRALVRLGLFLGLTVAALPLAVVRVPLGAVAYLLLVLGAAVALIRWHVGHTGFRCPECSTGFAIDAKTFVLTPHVGMTKLLPCPGCRAGRWCAAEPLTDEHSAASPSPAGEPDPSIARQLRIVLASCAVPVLAAAALALAGREHPPASAAVSLVPAAGALVALAVTLVAVPLYRFGSRHGLRSPIYLLLTALFVATNLVIGLVSLTLLAL